MPNPDPNRRGLRANPHTLGVEPLEPDEVSRPVRVRGSRALHAKLGAMSAREIGEVLERALMGD
jgi:hypothetical protein